MGEKKASRFGFYLGLTELADEHRDIIVLDADLPKTTGSEAFRKAHPVIVDGSFREYYPDSDRIFTYVRENDSEMLYVILNFSATKFALQIPEEIDMEGAEVAVSNTGRKEFKGRVFDLMPYESVVFLKRK